MSILFYLLTVSSCDKINVFYFMIFGVEDSFSFWNFGEWAWLLFSPESSLVLYEWPSIWFYVLKTAASISGDFFRLFYIFSYEKAIYTFEIMWNNVKGNTLVMSLRKWEQIYDRFCSALWWTDCIICWNLSNFQNSQFTLEKKANKVMACSLQIVI